MRIFQNVPDGWEQEYSERTAETREQLTEDYFESREYREAEFVMCRRLSNYNRDHHVPWNRPGACQTCGVAIVYDARLNHHKAKICVPCAFRLAEEGLQSLEGLLGYSPDRSSASDEEFLAKLAARRQHDTSREPVRDIKPKETDVQKIARDRVRDRATKYM